MVKTEPVLAPAHRPQQRNGVGDGVLQQVDRDTDREQLRRFRGPGGRPGPFDETVCAHHDGPPEQRCVRHPTVMPTRAEVVLDPETVEDPWEHKVDVRQAGPEDRARDDQLWTPFTSLSAVSGQQDPGRDMSRRKHRSPTGCRESTRAVDPRRL